MRGKQSVRKGVWYIGGKKRWYRKQRGRGIPFRLIASAAAPFLDVPKRVRLPDGTSFIATTLDNIFGTK